MKPLVKITENIVEKNVSRLGTIQTHIFFNWKNIAGQYADVTFPDKIKLNKKKNNEGQMIIKVQNGFGPEIQHAIPFLLNQINSRFGYKAIIKIKIVQTDLGYIHVNDDNDVMLKNTVIN
ncbi:DciA family protein, partial [Alphaproteobacteria bacterium]|nr:DciA family protein [Alphaproteobacteria bacterium]